MLTLTDQADTIVTAIVTNQSEAADAGLRIHQSEGAGAPNEAAFAVQIVPAPEPADVVVRGEGSPVYLDELITDELDDKVLDAAVDEQGAVSFQILPKS
ncbi:Fe-S cluster assembly protein HesB [Arthrobacter sp. MYb211]|uniref:Fe-S cluster assembly protein HesB n=1 Tax=Micrococcaceae TaxID=1268 RepID=UPI000BB85245|nr:MULTISPECIES: Fe-S cluster assembly protein HesB [Micrococcaceae]PCC27288.1 Fe-S cluster assembly protein HesB [Glutamicibacter sp. BW80]PQZ99306.1 Fe-S cluster assembly protein HesB [Arthrobacter sp. MYb224]PRA06215.1 Fe-S cluster assembly protein HesB [Arthrobacter sp. MYb229]PRA09886.1 Fe-S cluster assembly protein HesB [Arthrobacter sp. MYb221]PRB53117.1 Fe-S cluster assembly protein HesB [Arthrobacter sp. MYb216]